jgi:signal transduction histidine kinase
LHPSVLQHAGLQPTLQRHCAEVAQQHQIRVAFTCEGTFDGIDPQVALGLFRIAQEAVQNSVRHGKAGTVTVRLSAADGTIDLHIVDDGVGFVSGRGSGSGLGLRSMDERARLVGGHTTIESTPGHGTSVLVSVPRSTTRGALPTDPDSPARNEPAPTTL